MKILSIYMLFLFVISFSSSKQVNESKEIEDSREKVNKNLVLGSCLIYEVLELDSDIISYSFNKSKDSLSFQGKVYDLLSKEPLIGANVELLPCSNYTNTDIYGLYNLNFKLSECDSFKISYIGYSTTAYAIKDHIKVQ